MRYIPRKNNDKWMVWDKEMGSFSHCCCFKRYANEEACLHAIAYYETGDRSAYDNYLHDVGHAMVEEKVKFVVKAMA